MHLLTSPDWTKSPQASAASADLQGKRDYRFLEQFYGASHLVVKQLVLLFHSLKVNSFCAFISLILQAIF